MSEGQAALHECRTIELAACEREDALEHVRDARVERSGYRREHVWRERASEVVLFTFARAT